MTEEKLFYFKKQLCIAACLNVGHIIMGYTVAWTAPIVPKLQDWNETPLREILSLSQASWIGSSFAIGGIIGPFAIAYLSNIIGRKICLILGGILSTVGYIILSLARQYAAILAGRFVCGFGLGILCVLHLVYIGEVASPRIRGVIITSTGVFHSFGSLLMYIIGPFLSYAETGYIMIAGCCLYVLGCLYIPESPVYHAMQGNQQEVVNILTKLDRRKDADKELEALIEKVTKIRNNKWQWQELIRNKCNRKSLLITTVTCLLQECCGLIAVIFFATTIFQEADSSIKPEVATIVMGVTQFITTLAAPLFVEKLGRKTLLLLSTGGCCVCMGMMGVFFYLQFLESSVITYIRWLPLCLLVLCNASFSFGLHIIPNTLLGEMFHSNVRSIGTSISMTLGWVTSIISVTSFGYIVESFGSYVMFFGYSLINASGFVFILFIVPETKGMDLKDIQIMMST